jgi:very-short-patch-repair endonuclease
MFNQQQIAVIVKMYEDGSSPYEIAEQYKTYSNKIRRLLVNQGCKLRGKSDAQKIALKKGRSEHPTEGKPRSSRVKQKISESVFSSWKNLPEEKKQERIDKAKEQWYNMSESERYELHRLAMEGVRKASKEGSKVEKFLYEELTKAGYSVLFHKKGLLANIDLEIDLCIPSIKTAIEIDGPTHFYPIWGEEKLQKHIKADADKAGLLLGSGFTVLRVRHITKNSSQKYKRELLNIIIEHLKDIESKFPNIEDRYIEIEVNS